MIKFKNQLIISAIPMDTVTMTCNQRTSYRKLPISGVAIFEDSCDLHSRYFQYTALVRKDVTLRQPRTVLVETALLNNPNLTNDLRELSQRHLRGRDYYIIHLTHQHTIIIVSSIIALLLIILVIYKIYAYHHHKQPTPPIVTSETPRLTTPTTTTTPNPTTIAENSPANASERPTLIRVLVDNE